ncbi:MAG: GldG family protein [Treponema sp.]|jgi:gliding-associated putative ABC transporter substrate-binding component GldG|nr:GldG family protein [Treponema sp.]
MTRKQTAVITLLTIIVLALALLVSRRIWFRLDLTKSRAYTISAVSRNLHNEIPDQVRITYYLSDKLRAIHPLPGEIEDLLREYTAFSRGKIQLTVRDPARANLVAQVEQLGIQAQQIQTVDQDQASVMTVYSGVVIEYLDQIEVLPVVFALDTLEYDLTSRIRSLVRGTQRVIGVIAGDDPRGWNEKYPQLQNAFYSAGYQFRLIAPGQDIPDTLSILMVLGGVETFDDASLYSIDRYVQSGGKALFTVKGISVDTQSNLEARLLNDSGLLAMLSSYGVTVRPEIAMDRSALTMQYQTRANNGALMMRIVRNPQWIRVLGENGNKEHPVSARFSGLDLYWPGPLDLNPPDQVEAVPLFTSTVEAWSMLEPYNTNPEIAYLLEKDAASTKGVKILGASLTGIFPSWFKDRPRPLQGNGLELAAMPDEAKPARIIVVGDTDFATSFLTVTGGQRNLDFMLQAADWLGNDDDIIGIRSRDSSSGRLDRIIDPEKRAAAMRLAQIINVFAVPLLVIAAGIFFALRRRAKARIRSGAAETVPASGAKPLGADGGDSTKEYSDGV